MIKELYNHNFFLIIIQFKFLRKKFSNESYKRSTYEKKKLCTKKIYYTHTKITYNSINITIFHVQKILKQYFK